MALDRPNGRLCGSSLEGRWMAGPGDWACHCIGLDDCGHDQSKPPEAGVTNGLFVLQRDVGWRGGCSCRASSVTGEQDTSVVVRPVAEAPSGALDLLDGGEFAAPVRAFLMPVTIRPRSATRPWPRAGRSRGDEPSCLDHHPLMSSTARSWPIPPQPWPSCRVSGTAPLPGRRPTRGSTRRRTPDAPPDLGPASGGGGSPR